MAKKEDSVIERKIDEIAIHESMEDNFIDYAMSVIVARAIPDARDGLKPVHRRILHAMNDLGMTPDKPFKKSARIVGEVIGKYHPHGDSAVYESMVRMVQPFSLEEPLVLGHGNFGSMNEDPAAAMRYTEAKLSPIAMELLRDIKRGTVDYVDNFDGEEKEPAVLPGRFPNLFVNGAEGIAVGMATKMAPHNTREVCHGIVHLLDNPDASIEELMEFVKGPDFPLGASIMGDEGIVSAYETGRGTVKIRSKTEIEEINGTTFIKILELPYQVSKKKIISSIQEEQIKHDVWSRDREKKGAKIKEEGMDFVVRDGVQDLTDRNTLRNRVEIAIELKRGVDPRIVLNHLYKHTPLQITYSIINLALVPRVGREGKEILVPKVMNLKQLMEEYLRHQRIVETRKQNYLLAEKQQKMHLMEGLIKALNVLDETIACIRSAKTRNEAEQNLVELLVIDKDQAKHILDQRLHTLASFEQDEKRAECDKLAQEINDIADILADKNRLTAILKEMLLEMALKYGRDRETQLMAAVEDINLEDTIVDEDAVVTITHKGFIKRTLESTYRTQRRNGRGVSGMDTYDDDFVEHLHIAKTHDNLLFFTNTGKVYKLKIYQIPELSRTAKGTSLKNLLNLLPEEKIQAVLSIREFTSKQHLLFATKKGIVKKTELSEYQNIRRTGIAAISLKSDDEVIGVSLATGDKNVMLVTKKGFSITFESEDVRPVGRIGTGVKGIELQKGDDVVAINIHEDYGDLFVATSTGYGKRTPLTEFRVQNRGGKGVTACKITDKNGAIVGTRVVQTNDSLMLITKNGTLIKLTVDNISQFGRATQGTKIMNLRDQDELQAIARVVEEIKEDELLEEL
jgi:DNA gyrase subunit A